MLFDEDFSQLAYRLLSPAQMREIRGYMDCVPRADYTSLLDATDPSLAQLLPKTQVGLRAVAHLAWHVLPRRRDSPVAESLRQRVLAAAYAVPGSRSRATTPAMLGAALADLEVAARETNKTLGPRIDAEWGYPDGLLDVWDHCAARILDEGLRSHVNARYVEMLETDQEEGLSAQRYAAIREARAWLARQQGGFAIPPPATPSAHAAYRAKRDRRRGRTSPEREYRSKLLP